MRSAPLLPLIAALALSGCDAGSPEPDEARASDLTAEAAAPGGSGEGLVILPPDEIEGVGPRIDPELERAYFHSFGRVKNGEVVSHVFRLLNTDPRPVAIQSIKPGCGCTVPSVRYTAEDGSVVQGLARTTSGKPLITVPPGAIAEIDLEVDTRSISTKNADKTVQTTVTTDSPNGFYVKLETHILVELPFHLVPNGINFGGVPISAGGRGTMDLVAAPGYDLELVEITRLPDAVTAELRRKTQPGNPAWMLVATLAGPLEEGRWTGEAEISTRHSDGTPGDPVIVPMQADTRPDLICSPARLVFVANAAESGAEVVLSSLLMGHRPRVLRTELPPEHEPLFEVAFEAESPDSSGGSPAWILRMKLLDGALDDGDITELLRGTLRVHLDDPQHPEVDVPYVVHPASR